MPLYSSRHIFFLYICLFLILFYCSTEIKVHNLWLHFESLFNCIASRLHTTLSLLWRSEVVSLPYLKYTCPDVGVRAALPSLLATQTRAPWRMAGDTAGHHGTAQPCLGACLLFGTLIVQYSRCKYSCADACKMAFHLTRQDPKITPAQRHIHLNIQDQHRCSYFTFVIGAIEIKALCLCFYVSYSL